VCIRKGFVMFSVCVCVSFVRLLSVCLCVCVCVSSIIVFERGKKGRRERKRET